jgi:hypothetical protein
LPALNFLRRENKKSPAGERGSRQQAADAGHRGIAVRTRHVAFRHRGVAARRTRVAVSVKQPPISIATNAVMSAIVKRSPATNWCPWKNESARPWRLLGERRRRMTIGGAK